MLWIPVYSAHVHHGVQLVMWWTKLGLCWCSDLLQYLGASWSV